MKRKNLALISLVLILVVGVSEVSMRPYLQDRAISRDASGLLRKLGIKDLSDLRFIRIYTKDQQTLELAPTESLRDMRGLLACLADAKPGAVFASDPQDQVYVVLKNGKHAAINVYKDHITSRFGTCRYEAPGLQQCLDAIVRKPIPWIANAHLRASAVSHLQADIGNNTRISSQSDNVKDEAFQRIVNLAQQVMDSVDRRNLQSLDRIREDAGSEQTLPLYPHTSLSYPAVYVEFSKPFRETVLMPKESVRSVTKDEIIYDLQEDSFLTKKVAIYSEGGRLLIALIPASGRPWYVYGGDWLDKGLAQQWGDRVQRYGRSSVPAAEIPSSFPHPYRSISNLYAEMTTLLRQELDSGATD